MVRYVTMIIVNIAEAKAKLSEYLDAVAAGQHVIICKRNRPVAELRPAEAPRTEARPIGLGKGEVSVPASFFEPLPDDVLDGFEGGRRSAHARLAKRRETYRVGSRKRR